MREQRGFTLLELLIAISIFALLASIAYGGLSIVLTSREHTEAIADRLGELQIALVIMQRDIEQATTRSVRDEYGDRKKAFLSNSDTGSYLELTSNGHTNPLKRVRSSLQRVAYHFSEGELTRSIWPVLDAPQEAVPNKSILLNNLTDVRFRYLDPDLQWQQQWPSEAYSGSGEQTPVLPVAVELTLEYKEWGEIKRLFRLPDAQIAATNSTNK